MEKTPITAHYIKNDGKAKPVKHSDYDHTISGLLHKRVKLFHEAEGLRDRIAEIKNDIDAMDRTLTVLGYDGDLDAAMPRQKRQVVFGRGELTKAVLSVLRRSKTPMTAREIAQELISQSGFDARDRKYITQMSARVAKACRQYPQKGMVKKATDAHGNVVWSV